MFTHTFVVHRQRQTGCGKEKRGQKYTASNVLLSYLVGITVEHQRVQQFDLQLPFARIPGSLELHTCCSHRFGVSGILWNNWCNGNQLIVSIGHDDPESGRARVAAQQRVIILIVATFIRCTSSTVDACKLIRFALCMLRDSSIS